MSKFIAILEDNAERIGAMSIVLDRAFPGYSRVTCNNAPDFIAWLRIHLVDTVLICLDHDLGPNHERAGEVFDPGIGRDVADYLGTQPAVCPVVVHSSNVMAVPGMLRVLQDAGWTCSAVVPSDDVGWIASEWFREIKGLRERGLIYG